MQKCGFHDIGSKAMTDKHALVPTNRPTREKPSGKPDVSPRLETALCTLVRTGCTQEQAAKAAGLRREHISRSLAKPHVRRRYEELLRERLFSLAPRAVSTVEELLGCESSHVRLKAAETVMDRVGLGKQEQPLSRSEVIINIDLS
jgi:hypothetical protein